MPRVREQVYGELSLDGRGGGGGGTKTCKTANLSNSLDTRNQLVFLFTLCKQSDKL